MTLHQQSAELLEQTFSKRCESSFPHLHGVRAQLYKLLLHPGGMLSCVSCLLLSKVLTDLEHLLFLLLDLLRFCLLGTNYSSLL